MAVRAYAEKSGGAAPAELFLHGKVGFAAEEWHGFQEGVGSSATNLVGIKIRDEPDLRLFRTGSHPVLRGIAHIRHPRSAYLWTKGMAPVSRRMSAEKYRVLSG